jgi:hypothetical protein
MPIEKLKEENTALQGPRNERLDVSAYSYMINNNEILPAGSNDGSIELLITSPPVIGDSAVGDALIWIDLRWRRDARSFCTGR